jgi:hypothetical protein
MDTILQISALLAIAMFAVRQSLRAMLPAAIAAACIAAVLYASQFWLANLTRLQVEAFFSDNNILGNIALLLFADAALAIAWTLRRPEQKPKSILIAAAGAFPAVSIIPALLYFQAMAIFYMPQYRYEHISVAISLSAILILWAAPMAIKAAGACSSMLKEILFLLAALLCASAALLPAADINWQAGATGICFRSFSFIIALAALFF